MWLHHSTLFLHPGAQPGVPPTEGFLPALEAQCYHHDGLMGIGVEESYNIEWVCLTIAYPDGWSIIFIHIYPDIHYSDDKHPEFITIYPDSISIQMKIQCLVLGIMQTLNLYPDVLIHDMCWRHFNSRDPASPHTFTHCGGMVKIYIQITGQLWQSNYLMGVSSQYKMV